MCLYRIYPLYSSINFSKSNFNFSAKYFDHQHKIYKEALCCYEKCIPTIQMHTHYSCYIWNMCIQRRSKRMIRAEVLHLFLVCWYWFSTKDVWCVFDTSKKNLKREWAILIYTSIKNIINHRYKPVSLFK